jgi:hypothetical protein
MRTITAVVPISGVPKNGVFSVEGAERLKNGLVHILIDVGPTPEAWRTWKVNATVSIASRLLTLRAPATINDILFEIWSDDLVKADVGVTIEVEDSVFNNLQKRLAVESKVPDWVIGYLNASFRFNENPLRFLRKIFGGVWKFEHGKDQGHFSSVYWNDVKIWSGLTNSAVVPITTSTIESDKTMRRIEYTSMGPTLVDNNR